MLARRVIGRVDDDKIDEMLEVIGNDRHHLRPRDSAALRSRRTRLRWLTEREIQQRGIDAIVRNGSRGMFTGSSRWSRSRTHRAARRYRAGVAKTWDRCSAGLGLVDHSTHRCFSATPNIPFFKQQQLTFRARRADQARFRWTTHRAHDGLKG